MIGTVKNYNEETKVGYIDGYDDIVYFFKQEYVKENITLKENDIVRFDYLMYKKEETPIAIKIERV